MNNSEQAKFKQLEELCEQRLQHIKNLSSTITEQRVQIDELLAGKRPAEELQAEIDAKKKELDELVEQVGSLSAAKEIIDNKDGIMAEADKSAFALLADAQREVDSINAQIVAAQKQLTETTELIGVYGQADEIIGHAETRATDIITKAEYDAKQIESAAKQREAEIVNAAQEKRQEAERVFKEETARGKIQLDEAAKSAREIVSKATEEADGIRANMKFEGEAVKEHIVSVAEQEKSKILELAKIDAAAIADGIKKGADSYAEKTRQSADEYAEKVRNKADDDKKKALAYVEQIRNDIALEKEKILTEAQNKAAQIIEKARQKREADIERLKEREKELAADREELDADIDRFEVEKAAVERRKNLLQNEVDSLVEEKHAALVNEVESARATANETKRLNDQLIKKLESHRHAKLNDAAVDQFNTLLEALKKRKSGKSVEAEIAELLGQQQQYEALQRTYNSLLDKYNKLSQDNGNLQLNRAKDIQTQEELDITRRQKEYYEQTAKNLLAELDKRKVVTRDDMLAPVKTVPEIINQNRDRGLLPLKTEEKEWLDNIIQCAEQSGLYFTKRQLYAYHTAQKIRDMSSMTVVAGVSGTGKSELAKIYAEYGGMHFLSVPVKPDWDSPASLFGYYNSIERRFEATDLLRAIWQMSTANSNQMLMILLDEMNLAHPEQYFADLLSKLETSRGTGSAPAYEIVLGGGEKPEPVKIGGNVLWTGTMNEDETTKGLSDKVIDRSTLITFPRPKELRSRNNIDKQQKPSDMLRFETWQDWVKGRKCGKPEDAIEKLIAGYRGAVEKINECMSHMGRNLGHRVWQGIEAYIRNYPTVISAKTDDELVKTAKIAFTDAIAFKIMPKLRGVEVTGKNEKHLDKIGEQLKQDADSLVADYNNARNLPTELFQWSSATFMNEPNEGN